MPQVRYMVFHLVYPLIHHFGTVFVALPLSPRRVRPDRSPRNYPISPRGRGASRPSRECFVRPQESKSPRHSGVQCGATGAKEGRSHVARSSSAGSLAPLSGSYEVSCGEWESERRTGWGAQKGEA